MMQTEQQSVCELSSGERLRVLQITDAHLCANPGGTLLSLDTDHSLSEVIRQAKNEQPTADLILVTGDLADNGAEQAYQRLQTYFNDAFEIPVFWLAGNHDDCAAMKRVVGDGQELTGSIETPHWQILMLNSQIPGEVGGELGPDQLDWLNQRLEASAKRGVHVLLCLHHHPVDIGCAWLDEQRIADAEDFWAVIQRHPHVRVVMWGHVHQEYDQMRGDVRLLASPSTCVQFKPHCEDFTADTLAPGYRWLDLHADGRIDTGVSRVTDVAFTVDLESGGYL